MKKILSVFLCSVALLTVFVFPASAKTYNDEFPSYIPSSGGTYCEFKNSTFQRCAFVVPIDFQKHSFSFADNSASNVFNHTRSTISGYLYTSNGERYDCRFTSQSTLEYRTNGSYNQWQSLPMGEILNTNIVFEDLKGLDRQNDNPYFTQYEKVNLTFSFMTASVLVLGSFILITKKLVFKR